MSLPRTATRIGLAIATTLGAAGSLDAQTRTGSPYYQRDHNVAVSERPHPELDPLGLRIGSFLATPSVTAAVTYDDNIYALNRNRTADGIADFAAAADISSDWLRHALTIHGEVKRHQYFTARTESTTDARAFGLARVDLGEGSFTLRGDAARLTQPRTDVDAPNAVRSPIRYGRVAATATGEQEFGRLRLLGSLDWRRFRFSDVGTAGGLVLDQHYRDRDVISGDARLDLAISPRISVYVDATGNSRSYRQVGVPLNRDSRGYTVEAGADFDITRLIRGHAQFGYLSQMGEDDLWTFSGFSGRGRVEWFTTPLVTLTVEGGRTIEDSAESDAPAYVSTNVAGRADYELLRSLIVTLSGGVTWDNFQGIDRRARRYDASIAGRYRMGRRVVLELGFQHLGQTDSGTADQRQFSDNRTSLAVRLQR